MPGPAKRPPQLNALFGDPGHRGETKDNRKAVLDRVPQAPNWLSEKGKLGWYSLGQTLINMNVLDQSNLVALGVLCQMWANYLELNADVQKNGHYQTVATKGGDAMERARPAAAMLADTERRLLTYLQQFGLTPATLNKITIQGDGGNEDDPASQYFDA